MSWLRFTFILLTGPDSSLNEVGVMGIFFTVACDSYYCYHFHSPTRLSNVRTSVRNQSEYHTLLKFFIFLPYCLNTISQSFENRDAEWDAEIVHFDKHHISLGELVGTTGL